MASEQVKQLLLLIFYLKSIKNSFYRAIILVPTTALLFQWKEDCQDFNFKNIIISDERDWRKK